MRAGSFLLLVFVALFLGACATRRLPPYEPPIARAEFQQVRTTAYTHTEADHEEYGNRNALGGILHAASPAVAPPRAIPVAQRSWGPPQLGEIQRIAYTTPSQPFTASYFEAPIYGSAAADWSRWPAGTIFRVISTGQLYRVEDYGWALSGRNTIDLYMATPGQMNGWGVRNELIQVVQWGDPAESLRRLAPHTRYRHIKRMVLELEGKHRAAASME